MIIKPGSVMTLKDPEIISSVYREKDLAYEFKLYNGHSIFLSPVYFNIEVLEEYRVPDDFFKSPPKTYKIGGRVVQKYYSVDFESTGIIYLIPVSDIENTTPSNCENLAKGQLAATPLTFFATDPEEILPIEYLNIQGIVVTLTYKESYKIEEINLHNENDLRFLLYEEEINVLLFEKGVYFSAKLSDLKLKK